MRNVHQKLSIYQLLPLSCVYIPSQGMNITLIITLLSNMPPMILPAIFYYDNLLLIQVYIYIFCHLLLQQICLYILNTTQAIKHRKVHTYLKIQGYSNSGSPSIINNSPCSFLGRFYSGSYISTSYFEHKNTSKQEIISFFCPSLN